MSGRLADAQDAEDHLDAGLTDRRCRGITHEPEQVATFLDGKRVQAELFAVERGGEVVGDREQSGGTAEPQGPGDALAWSEATGYGFERAEDRLLVQGEYLYRDRPVALEDQGSPQEHVIAVEPLVEYDSQAGRAGVDVARDGAVAVRTFSSG